MNGSTMTDIAGAWGWWLFVVAVAFFVSIAFDKLAPLFKIVFWGGVVALVVFIIGRVGFQGLWELVTRLDELGRKAVSE